MNVLTDFCGSVGGRQAHVDEAQRGALERFAAAEGFQLGRVFCRGRDRQGAVCCRRAWAGR
jgi:hypothetical protein